jgi:anti-sigma-K factor RskA
MSAMHEEQTLAAAYVLGALEADERRAFEAHAAGCAACADEIRSLQRVTDVLAQSVPQRTPRPELRAQVLNAIAPGAAQAPASVRSSSSAPSGSILSGWLPLAAAIAIAVGAGAYAWQLQQRVRALEARLDTAERRASVAEREVADARRTAGEAQAAMSVLAAPDLVKVELAGQPPAPTARARALWSRNRGMVFTATNLPQAPAGRVYQVWVVTAGGPVSAGLMNPDASGRAEVFFNTPSDIAPPTAIAVTLETAGGVPAPSGEAYLHGTPAL